MTEYYSDCYGALVRNPSLDSICPDCQEHCDVVHEDPDEEIQLQPESNHFPKWMEMFY